jgi:hypothetical protein
MEMSTIYVAKSIAKIAVFGKHQSAKLHFAKVSKLAKCEKSSSQDLRFGASENGTR